MTFNRLTGTALLSALALWMLPCAADQASSLTLSTDEQHEDDSEGHFLISDDSKQHDDHEGNLLANDDEKHDDHGRFLARAEGPVSGNVLLRREQYRRSDDGVAECDINRE